ncbi:GldM family protein [Winogradskyella endarachnes]|uniref:Uncharacterized protein n=1 Tax=Winogradskyella endarachnes TaxID=2681965 RepID=A0A6L6UC24_9FLAO|nr:GldM family protein [Winogradskyella endarachnes]MUU79850.1 hypothetical protein [Winogradskyella endarachnes]
MKRLVLFLSLLFLLQSCKSSYSRTELLKENKALKERIKKLETADTVNKEAALELKKMNVVFRGVSNPIYISKPNAVSFEATAFGLRKLDSLGNYILSPGTGKTVDITIKSKLKNGDSLIETKTLRIKDISAPIGTINGIGCGSKCELKLKKEDLTNSVINAEMKNFLHDLGMKVISFKVKMPHFKTLEINGNKMNVRANDLFTLLQPNDSVIIFDIKIRLSGSSRYRLKGVAPIVIKIIE